jgi:hypothetical protein
VIRPSQFLPALVNQTAPSGPVTKSSGEWIAASVKLVTVPVVVILPIELPLTFVNHSAPSGPATMFPGALIVGSAKLLTTPLVAPDRVAVMVQKPERTVGTDRKTLRVIDRGIEEEGELTLGGESPDRAAVKFVNQSAPSGPVTKLKGVWMFASVKVLTLPVRLSRAIAVVVVNQIAPSGPAVIRPESLALGKLVTVPVVVMRTIELLPKFVNQSAPSGPAAIESGRSIVTSV